MNIRCFQRFRVILLFVTIIILNTSIAWSATATITTSKRGYVTSTHWEWLSSDMRVGYDDNPAVNNVAHRAFAWFDIPSAARNGVITSARITVQVKDISEWNDLLNYIDLYTTGSTTWNDFYNSSFGSGWEDGHWAMLAGVNYQDDITKSSTKTFYLIPSELSGKSQQGFTFLASPEIPSGSWGDQSHKIILNNPTLIITYTTSQPPSKATNPSPSNGATNQSRYVDPSWSNGGGATSYNVYFGTDPTPDSGEYKSNQSGTSYNPGTLSYSTTYYWRIDAKNSDGTTTGYVWHFTTEAAPSTITLSSPNGNESWQRGTSKNISWSSSGSPGSYVKIELYKGGSLNRTITSSTSNDGTYSWPISLSQAVGTDYQVEVTSTSNSSYVDHSDSYFSITDIDVTSPNGGESWERGTTHNITWVYSNNSGSTVLISLYKNNTFVTEIKETTNDGVYPWSIPSNISAGSDYKIRVWATGAEDLSNSNFSIVPLVTPTAGTPSSITVPTSDSDGSYTVSWGSSSTSSVTYVLEEATNSSFSSGLRQAYSGTSRNKTITGRSSGVRYYYRVKATRSGYTDSDWRKGLSSCLVTIIPTAPTNVSATDGTYMDKVRITWSSSSGATSYEVYRATSSGGTKSKVGTPSGTSYDDISASTGTTYYYWVKARNSYGTSGYSSYNPGHCTGIDTDNDGLPDNWENQHFGNLTTADNTTDIDGDGLLDKDEYAYGTDPNNTDSDGDGDSDGDEVLYGSDPTLHTDTLDSHKPNTPVVLPISGSVSLRGQIFDVYGFGDPDQGDYLSASEWQISTDQNFNQNNIILQRILERWSGAADDAIEHRRLLMPQAVLVKANTYWIRTRHRDSKGLWSLWAVPVGFITVTDDPNDLDNNDIDDACQVPGYTDTNNNGTDDSQENIHALYDAEKGNTIGIHTDSGTLGGLNAIPNNEIPAELMPEHPMPSGLFSFRIDGLPVDASNPATVDITFYFSEPLPSNTKWYKYDPANYTMSDFTSNLTINGNCAVLTLTDGGPGDDDGVVNGIIIDPGGAAVPSTSEPTPEPTPNPPSNGGGGGGGGGCFITTAAP